MKSLILKNLVLAIGFGFALQIFLVENAAADFVFTDCKKWSEEGVGLFECSNEKAYAVGNALCITVDSRRNGKANTSHPEKPIEVFCRWRLREDLKSCVNDASEEVITCYREFQSRGGTSKAPRSAAPAKTVN